MPGFGQGNIVPELQNPGLSDRGSGSKSGRSRDYTRALSNLKGTKLDGWLTARSPAPFTCLVLTNMPPMSANDIMACWSLRVLSFIFSAFFSGTRKEDTLAFWDSHPVKSVRVNTTYIYPRLWVVNKNSPTSEYVSFNCHKSGSK